MILFTVKRYSNFRNWVCYLFILYNILNTYHRIEIHSGHHKPDMTNLSVIPDLICLVTTFVYSNLSILIVILLINLIGIVSAILTLNSSDIGRKTLIVLFKINIVFNVLNIISEIAIAYLTVLIYLQNTQLNFFRCIWITNYNLQHLIESMALIFLLLWIIKQFKSPGIKNLFHKKSVPEITGTL